ncbi:hypothetical protein BOX37_28220 [Nocardia mangyaensis]|uniref:Integrase n=1 Tax=Nocardia mangyaensis TaxID=2213200 RepID=A0A1J0VYN7_9NOCA|nr:hypothetical protein [Nocardia mangyaensis]APE37172.1 hypothetical protein BOX37_28220 [Nocardia mangyaensis]
MTLHPFRTPADSARFGGDEEVIQSHPLLPNAQPPRFGQADVWDLNDVVERPVNQKAANYRVSFVSLSPAWNLRAREMALIWLNPRHPAVVAAGIHLNPDPREPRTVTLRAGTLRALAAWATDQGLPDDLHRWDREDFHRYIGHQADRLKRGSVIEHVVVIKTLHQFRAVLTCGGLAADPWPGQSASHVLGLRDTGELATPVIRPQTWFPLIKAAWTYIEVFGPDILRARAVWVGLQQNARPLRTADADAALARWLADPDHRVPVHTGRTGADKAGKVHWSLLSALLGASDRIFHLDHSSGRARRAVVEAELVDGRATQSGIITDLANVARPDGTTGPWHPDLQPLQMWLECVALRNACYIFVAAMSMMRDNEIRAITHHSVVDHYGAPAVKSIKRKRDPGHPTRHWWIIEPVARALFVASELSEHPDLTFGRVRSATDTNGLFDSTSAIKAFTSRVNAHRHDTGLEEIPADHVTAHMFRRTMAMLTRDYAGAEIALGIQLKHAATRALANRSTQGYSAKDPAWAGYFDEALADARFDRLRELYQAHRRGDTFGYGPGADQLRSRFDAMAGTAAQHGDARVEYDLLRRTRIPIRFGTLNHCVLDETNPVDAKCLENAIVPAGHHGPLVDRCQPARCANSVIATEHLPIWRSEEGTLLTLLDTPKLPSPRRAQLQRELADVRTALRRAEQ